MARIAGCPFSACAPREAGGRPPPLRTAPRACLPIRLAFGARAAAIERSASSALELLRYRPWRASRAVLVLRARLVRRAASAIAHRASSLPARTTGIWRARCCRRALCELSAGAAALQAAEHIACCPCSVCAPREAGGRPPPLCTAPRACLSVRLALGVCAAAAERSATSALELLRYRPWRTSRAVLFLRARLVRRAGGLHPCAPRLELVRSYHRPSACPLLPSIFALPLRRIPFAGGPGAHRVLLFLCVRASYAGRPPPLFTTPRASIAHSAGLRRARCGPRALRDLSAAAAAL